MMPILGGVDLQAVNRSRFTEIIWQLRLPKGGPWWTPLWLLEAFVGTLKTYFFRILKIIPLLFKFIILVIFKFKLVIFPWLLPNIKQKINLHSWLKGNNVEGTPREVTVILLQPGSVKKNIWHQRKVLWRFRKEISQWVILPYKFMIKIQWNSVNNSYKVAVSQFKSSSDTKNKKNKLD